MTVRMMLFISFILSLTVFEARAQTPQLPLLWCDGCTAAQTQAKALTQPPGATVYVGNLTARSVSAYTIYLDVDDSTQPPRRTKMADPIATTQPYQNAANSLINFYHAAPAGWTKSKEVHYDGPVAGDRIAYDVVNQSPARNEFLDWANDNTSLSVYVLDHVYVFTTSVVPIESVTVTFWDGSKIELDLNIYTNEWSMVKDSGRDSNNNTILSTATEDPIQFMFSDVGYRNPADVGRWANQMSLLGYTGQGARKGTWACTKSAAGHHCVYITQ